MKRKDRLMKNDTNVSNKSIKKLRRVLLLSICGFVALILIVGLLYVTLGENSPHILANFNSFASIVLKVTIAYFFIETGGFLHSYRRPAPYLHKEKREEKQNCIVPETGMAPAESVSKEQKKAQQVVQNQQVVQDRQVYKPRPSIIFPQPEGTTDKVAANRQAEKHLTPAYKIRFSLFGTEADKKKAIDIIEGTRQGTIFLTPSDEGVLIGDSGQGDQYIVYPYEEWLTETELRYSPIAACFEIDGPTCEGQKAKVRCDEPAILIKEKNGMYGIFKRGLLSVVDVLN